MGGYTRELPDGTVVYSASSIGYCPAALYYDRLGVTHEPPPENIRKAWSEGNDNESRILSLLEAQKVWRILAVNDCAEAGFTFGEYDADRGTDYSEQVRVEKNCGTGIVVRAHLDGIADLVPEELTINGQWFGKDDRVIVEAKAFGDSYWQQFESKGLAAFPNYEWQVSVQMHASGLPCVFVCGKKNKLGVVDFVKAEIITTPPISWGKIVAKIAGVERALANNQPPKCPEPYMYPCPFYTRHDDGKDIFGQAEGDDNGLLVVEGQRAKTLHILAERYHAHKLLEAEHKREAEAAKSALLGYFGEQAGEAGIEDPLPIGVPVKAEGWTITAKPGSRAGNINPKKLEQDGIDVDKYRNNPSSWVSIEVEQG